MTLSDSEAKVLAMVVIGVSSLLVGLFPACFTHRRGEQKLLLSSLLCFGAGVLLATSMLHMLPETRESLPLYAELVLCAGFLLLYMVDEIVHLVWGKVLVPQPEIHSHQAVTNQRHDFTHNQQQNNAFASHGCGHSHIGADNSSDRLQTSNQFSLPSVVGCSNGVLIDQNGFEPDHISNLVRGRHCSQSHYGSIPDGQPSASNVPVSSSCEEKETLLCHGQHTEPCPTTNTGLAGLLIALTLHAILEGLAVGLQSDANRVLLLLGAVALHKLVVGFCLGMEFASTASSFLKHALAIAVFAGGSSAGIGIGMMVTQIEANWVSNILMPVLQGVAAGSLLYVTISEVLPRERAKWHKTPRRIAGVMQFFSVTCGFFFMFIVMKYTADAEVNTGPGKV